MEYNFKLFCITVGTCSAVTLFYLSFCFVKQKGKICKCRKSIDKKIVAITGASSGIGYEVALQVAQFGAKVYICSRNKILGETITDQIIKRSGNPYVQFIPLDLTSCQSCHQCAQLLLQAEPKLDVLIHCAAVFHEEPKLTADGFELTYQTNFLGPVILTEHLFPLLLDAPSPRIVFVNSEAHKVPSLDEICKADFKNVPSLPTFDRYIHHYGSSKLALKLYAINLAQQNKGLGVGVASVDPGNVWTPIYRHCWTRWYEQPFRWICSLLMRSPKIGAQSVIHAAAVQDLTTGSYVQDCIEKVHSCSRAEAEVASSFMEQVYDVLKIK